MVQPTDRTTIRDVEVTRLGLGSAPLGGLFTPVNEEDALATVQKGYELGLRFFDTAPLYGYGTAERRVGTALGNFPRGSFALETKVGRLLREVDENEPGDMEVDQTQMYQGEPFYKSTGRAVPVFDFTYDGAKQSLEESLRRLGSDHVDIVHVHDPESHVDQAMDGAVRAMLDLRDEGVVGAVGVGIDFTEPATRFINETDIDCLLIAGRWSLLDDSALHTLLPAASTHGKSILAAGVFNSGVLADPWTDTTFDYVPCPPEIRARAQKMDEVCRRFDVPLQSAAIQYPYLHETVAAVVVGARTPEEIEQNVAFAQVEIPQELWLALHDECDVPLCSVVDTLAQDV